METRRLVWQELNYMQALDVLRGTDTLVAAAADADGPYLVVMHFQLEMQGVQPILHMTAGEGRLLRCLRTNPHMALLFRRDTCTGAETVLAEGMAEVVAAGNGYRIRMPVEEMAARNWFMG